MKKLILSMISICLINVNGMAPKQTESRSPAETSLTAIQQLPYSGLQSLKFLDLSQHSPETKELAHLFFGDANVSPETQRLLLFMLKCTSPQKPAKDDQGRYKITFDKEMPKIREAISAWKQAQHVALMILNALNTPDPRERKKSIDAISTLEHCLETTKLLFTDDKRLSPEARTLFLEMLALQHAIPKSKL